MGSGDGHGGPVGRRPCHKNQHCTRPTSSAKASRSGPLWYLLRNGSLLMAMVTQILGLVTDAPWKPLPQHLYSPVLQPPLGSCRSCSDWVKSAQEFAGS